jgi:uncharacterized membrane protein
VVARGSAGSRLAVTAGVRVAFSAGAGVAVAVVVAALGPWPTAPLVGWDVASVVFLVWMWRSLVPADPKETSRLAARENSARPIADVALLLASVASLVGVAAVLVDSKSKGGAVSPAAAIGIGITTIVLSWLVVHTVYTLRYAKLFYVDGQGSGVDFNQSQPPRYLDFAYLAFTIGMTFQVSDTDLQNSAVRATALRHMFLAYLFGAVIIATTINLVAGLAK